MKKLKAFGSEQKACCCVRLSKLLGQELELLKKPIIGHYKEPYIILLAQNFITCSGKLTVESFNDDHYRP